MRKRGEGGEGEGEGEGEGRREREREREVRRDPQYTDTSKSNTCSLLANCTRHMLNTLISHYT